MHRTTEENATKQRIERKQAKLKYMFYERNSQNGYLSTEFRSLLNLKLVSITLIMKILTLYDLEGKVVYMTVKYGIFV